MLDKKLQLKDGQTVAIAGNSGPLGLAAARASQEVADAVIIYVANEAQMRERLGDLQAVAARGALVWVAYPKAKQLGTDINRDTIRAIANDNGLDPVRQVALDETWSAMRLKSLQ